MSLKNLPIQQKLMAVMLLTSGAVLLLMTAGFVTYEVIAIRNTLVLGMTTRTEIIAASATTALASRKVEDVAEVLAPLKNDPRITAACVYDKDGNVFAGYPADAPPGLFPVPPGPPGHQFGQSYLAIFRPCIEGDQTVGMVYLKSDLSQLTSHYRAYALLTAVILGISIWVAYLLSKRLQKQISVPILALADTAKAVAARSDYSVRAAARGSDELGLLTDAFNQMLTQIEVQNQALHESESRVRAVLNSALSAVVVIDAAGRIMDWNARAERMLGWTRDEALGLVLAETIIPPRYREAHRRGLEYYFASGEGPVLNQLIELSALRRDGTEFPVEVSISPMKTGGVVTFCGFITDITERKRQEEVRARFVAIIQSSDDAIVSKTVDGIITSWNPGAERLFGYTAREVIGQPMLTLIPPERLDEEAENLERIARGETVRHYDTVRKRKDGTLVDTAVTISPIRDNLGKVVGASTIARDITERKRAEEQVLLQATALETAANAMLITDRAGTILWTNPAFSALTGYGPEEVIGRDPRILKSDKHDESFYKDLWSTILSGQTWRGGFTNRRKDGTLYQDEHTIAPVRSKDGTITHFIAIMQDVTERNRAQRVLRKSESQLRLVWENALDGMRLVDEEGVIRMVNEAYCRMIGKPREELEGQPMSVLFETHRHEEVVRRHRERFQARSIPAHFEKEITLWNGRTLFVELSNSFLEVEDQAPLLFSTFRDITERKQSEQRETAFAKLGQGLSGAPTAAEAARLIAATADEMFGWDACTLDVYAGDKDLIHPIINIDTIDGKRVDVPPAYVGQRPTTTMRRILEQGAQLLLRQEPFTSEMIPFGNTSRPSASLMHVPIRRGNSVIGILSIQSYTRDAYDEKALNVLQTLADQCAGALERVRAEENLRRLNEELERRVKDRTAQLESANKELEAFSYSVSHDLRAPLRHIDGFAEMLRKEAAASLSAPGQRFLGIISQSAKRMGALIDDLLVFSRMGRAALRPTRVRVDELVAEVLRDMTNDFEGRTISFCGPLPLQTSPSPGELSVRGLEGERAKLHWDIGPLPEVKVDRALFKQVWVNLLANAVKYTRQRAEALIQIRCQKNDQGEFEFSVKDNGAGFDMNFAGKLFGVFQRLHRAEEFEGTGIGLANVRRIVARHGGRTWAQGKVDAGATFYFTVPQHPNQKP